MPTVDFESVNELPLISEKTTKKVKRMLSDGWEFMLHFGDHSTYCSIDGLSWEADFTRRKEDGKWDNHESGYSLDPDDAINKAYENVKQGRKYKIYKSNG